MALTLPKVNKVIIVFVVGYFILNASFAFLPPFFAVYVTDQIVGGTVAVVGFALAISGVTKGTLQLFVARFIDKNHGEIDDFYFLLAGGFLNAVLITLYYLATEVWHVYTLHFLIGAADAMLVPPFYSIFTRHIDKGQESFEWSLNSTFSFSAGPALGGALGGVLVGLLGFRVVFLLAGLGVFLGTVILYFLKPYVKPKVAPVRGRIFIEHKRI